MRVCFLFLFIAITLPSYATSIPVYGNWCGPGHPKEGFSSAINIQPIDRLDGACKKHDQKYASGGCGGDEVCLCVADGNLIATAASVAHSSTESAEAIAAANTIARYFLLQAPVLCVWGTAEKILKVTETAMGITSEVVSFGVVKKERTKNLFNPSKWRW